MQADPGIGGDDPPEGLVDPAPASLEGSNRTDAPGIEHADPPKAGITTANRGATRRNDGPPGEIGWKGGLEAL